MRGESEVKKSFLKDSAFENNLFYGLVSGTVVFPHISVMNKSLKSSLKSLVSKMSQKNRCISAIFMAKSVPAVILHDEVTKRIDFFVNCTDRRTLDTELKKACPDMSEDIKLDDYDSKEKFYTNKSDC